MDDLRALPSDRLRRVALQWMLRLRRRPKLGQFLEWRWGPDLRGCRKIYFDEDDRPLELDFVVRRRSEEGAAYRIVYRILPAEERPELVQVFAVGPKYGPDEGVYKKAADRFRVLRDPEDR
jgi:hypothetical protein